ncbi:unnamed protein product [Parajaminaea phylloscopi]
MQRGRHPANGWTPRAGQHHRHVGPSVAKTEDSQPNEAKEMYGFGRRQTKALLAPPTIAPTSRRSHAGNVLSSPLPQRTPLYRPRPPVPTASPSYASPARVPPSGPSSISIASKTPSKKAAENTDSKSQAPDKKQKKKKKKKKQYEQWYADQQRFREKQQERKAAKQQRKKAESDRKAQEELRERRTQEHSPLQSVTPDADAVRQQRYEEELEEQMLTAHRHTEPRHEQAKPSSIPVMTSVPPQRALAASPDAHDPISAKEAEQSLLWPSSQSSEREKVAVDRSRGMCPAEADQRPVSVTDAFFDDAVMASPSPTDRDIPPPVELEASPTIANTRLRPQAVQPFTEAVVARSDDRSDAIGTPPPPEELTTEALSVKGDINSDVIANPQPLVRLGECLAPPDDRPAEPADVDPGELFRPLARSFPQTHPRDFRIRLKTADAPSFSMFETAVRSPGKSLLQSKDADTSESMLSEMVRTPTVSRSAGDPVPSQSVRNEDTSRSSCLSGPLKLSERCLPMPLGGGQQGPSYRWLTGFRCQSSSQDQRALLAVSSKGKMAARFAPRQQGIDPRDVWSTSSLPEDVVPQDVRKVSSHAVAIASASASSIGEGAPQVTLMLSRAHEPAEGMQNCGGAFDRGVVAYPTYLEPRPHLGGATAVTPFLPVDGASLTLATGGADGAVYGWSYYGSGGDTTSAVDTKTTRLHSLVHRQPVLALETLPKADLVVSACRSKGFGSEIVAFDARETKLLHSWKSSDHVAGMSRTSHSQVLDITLLRTDFDQHKLFDLRASHKPILSFGWSSDYEFRNLGRPVFLRNYCLQGCPDGYLRLWDVRKASEVQQEVRVCDSPLQDTIFQDHGRVIALSSKSVYSVELESGG